MATALIAVTHLLGSGHLVRARHLAMALAEAGHRVTLASGGMPPASPPAGPYAFVQLPPVKVEGVDFRNLLDEEGRPIGEARRVRRRAMLAELAASLRPDVVITEHFPFGRRQLADEFLGLIAAAKAANPDALILSSIRDVLVAPRPDRIVEAEQRLATLFDGVLVHGDAGFLPLEASWPVSPELAARLHYTGYLDGRAASSSLSPHPEEPRSGVSKDAPEGSGASTSILRDAVPAGTAPQDEGSEGRREIIVSGGGSAAALPLFRLCIAAGGLLGPERRWRILVGRGTAPSELAALQVMAPPHVAVEWARPDFPALLAASALSISQAGYNTVLDLVAARRPAIVVPFDAGNETEQRIRGEAMERAGLARALRHDEALTPERLAQAVRAALAAGPPPSATIDRSGASVSPRIVENLLAKRRSGMSVA